ncbi:hypothetical protein INT47_001240 [Mucor saturninus]|uniref:Uncharacterized protein n=1 Tax=Mucor saturninus TaxID=64648 RepID=A0A8H7RNW6_9FUNG|nr:hypothetical protein INT47_001240 [Mucor saturninus]
MPFQPISEVRYENGNPFNRKFCGCMSMRGGCAIACAIWLGVNTYIATISFQGYNPIFSFLNRPALYVLGSLSIVFGLVAFVLLYGLFVDKARPLEIGVLLMSFIVPIYLLDILANVFVFGIQKSLYMDWCLTNSRDTSSENLWIIYDDALNSREFDPSSTSSLNTFNCQKLWEDEIKFSIAIFITMSICYIYWALCVFHYYRKIYELFPQMVPNPFMNYAPTRILPTHFYSNHPPSKN